MSAKPAVIEGSAAYPRPSPGPVVTIGNFDGVHRGHRHLLRRVIARAEELGAPSCVFTFDPAPRDVLRPGNPIPRIQTLAERVACLGEVGIDQVVVEPFTIATSQIPARTFAEAILRDRLGVRALVVGYDFRFGRGREGTVDDLVAWLGVPVEQVAPHAPDGGLISSSRIREAVRDGEMDEASCLLGRPHVLRGEVVAGDGRGRALGYPTANLALVTALRPPDGVYAVWVDLGDGMIRPGAMSVGVRPTFDDAGDRRFEVFVLDYEGDLYGRSVRVKVVRRLRGEQAFDTVEALKAGIERDLARVRDVLGLEAS